MVVVSPVVHRSSKIMQKGSTVTCPISVLCLEISVHTCIIEHPTRQRPQLSKRSLQNQSVLPLNVWEFCSTTSKKLVFVPQTNKTVQLLAVHHPICFFWVTVTTVNHLIHSRDIVGDNDCII